MIKITSQMLFALRVPFPTARGMEPEFFEVPAASENGPGVLTLEKLDNITIERLRWHYDWRPIDAKNKGKRKEELRKEEIAEIGLMTIEVVSGGKQRPAQPASAPAAS